MARILPLATKKADHAYVDAAKWDGRRWRLPYPDSIKIEAAQLRVWSVHHVSMASKCHSGLPYTFEGKSRTSWGGLGTLLTPEPAVLLIYGGKSLIFAVAWVAAGWICCTHPLVVSVPTTVDWACWPCRAGGLCADFSGKPSAQLSRSRVCWAGCCFCKRKPA